MKSYLTKLGILLVYVVKSKTSKGIGLIPCLRREINTNPKSDKLIILDVSDFSNVDNISTNKRSNKL